jgi:hypothetical protein
VNGSRGRTLTARLIPALSRILLLADTVRLLLADTVRAVILLLTWHELDETRHA